MYLIWIRSTNQLSSIKQLLDKNLPKNAALIPPEMSGSYPVHTPAPTNDIYNEAIRTLSEYHTLVKEYEHLSKNENAIEMPSWMRWEHDSADLNLLNTSLMMHSVRLVEQNLIPNAAKTVTSIGDEDVDQIAWELLEDSRPLKADETWGNVAEGMLHAMSGLAALLWF